jgi:phage terminase large subunit-like protein
VKGRGETADNAASHETARVCHRKIFPAVRGRQPETAAKEMAKHIKQTANGMNIEAFPKPKQPKVARLSAYSISFGTGSIIIGGVL